MLINRHWSVVLTILVALALEVFVSSSCEAYHAAEK